MKIKKLISAALAVVLTSFALAANTVTVEAASTEYATACLGIDVSRYQGQIDWAKVAASGVQFAMIRIGSRTATTGVIQEDEYAKYNLQEATKNGIKVGAYFYSTAVNAQEALEEAVFVYNIISKYDITFPVVYDCENYNKTSSRQYGLTKAQRTSIACTFMDAFAGVGYTPMFYGNRSAMLNNKDWDMDTIASKYKVWTAYYPNPTYPAVTTCGYDETDMWQFSDKFTISGISGNVDINLSYFDYTESAGAKDASGASEVTTANNTVYTPVSEIVTSTTSVNIRTTPSTYGTDNIAAKLEPGMLAQRVGLGNNGWSQISVNNQIYYVSTQYLTVVK